MIDPSSTSGDTPTRILAASREAIARHGVRGLRIQQVAKIAGVSTGLLYYHFTDRAGLIAATIDQVNQSAEVKGRVGGLRGRDSLEQALSAEFDDDLETLNGSIVWNEIRAAAVFEPDIRQALAASTARWEHSLIAALEEAGVPDTDRHEHATILTAIVEGLSSRWLSGQITSDAAKKLLHTSLSAIVGARISQTEK